MKRTPNDEAMRKRVVESILVAAVGDGLIDPSGKTDDELFADFREYLLALLKTPGTFNGYVDHSDDLLKRARTELKRGQYNFAATFYATWVEHWINWHIRCLAVQSKRISERQILEMTKEVQIRGRLSWLIETLGGKAISKTHRDAIQRLSDHRNAFIHYKYPSFDVDQYCPVSPQLKTAVDTFERTVKYLQGHGRVVVMKGIRMKIKKYAQRQLESERA